MRKLKLQVQVSVDGYMGGPHGELDWLCFDWDAGLIDYVNALTNPVGTIVLGRKLAEGFIPHWAAVAANPEAPDHSAGKKFTETPKVVFTRTMKQPPWPNTSLASGPLADEINVLKQQPGGDIIVYGGSTFVSSLVREGLIDDLHLLVNPNALGTGLPVFAPQAGNQPLTLVNAIPFACGIVVLHYQPKAG